MESHTINITKQVKTREKAETPYQVMSPSRRALFLVLNLNLTKNTKNLKVSWNEMTLFSIYPPLPTNIHAENSKMCFYIQSYKIERRNNRGRSHSVNSWWNGMESVMK